MIEIGKYTKAEISDILHTNGKQGIDRKLNRYGIEFTYSGRGANLMYSINKITNPFKVYCITELGLSANVDFEKFKYFCMYFFCDDRFSAYPIIAMEQILRKDGVLISRQTISKSIHYFERLNYVAVFKDECTYYAVNKLANDEKTYTEITKEKYSKGWHIYWEMKEEYGVSAAYYKMREYIGGHPCKSPKIEQNAFYLKEIETLISLITDSFLNQV